MTTKTKKYFKLSDEDLKREKRIISKLNLEKLPFKISSEKLCDLTVAMIRHSREVLKYQDERPGIKWCFSSIKRLKVFLREDNNVKKRKNVKRKNSFKT